MVRHLATAAVLIWTSSACSDSPVRRTPIDGDRSVTTLGGDGDAGNRDGTQIPGDTSASNGEPGGDSAIGGDSVDSSLYRSSLAACWTNAHCKRVMAIGHGGLWDTTSAPYDSDAALSEAFAGNMDGVKIDVRVTSDNIPVIAHSSPIEWFESLDCQGKRIEQMTAAEVTACHRLPSTTEIFQRLDDVLDYLRGKMVAQLTVKRSVDYARTIEEVHTLAAEDFAFLEISPTELQTLIPTLPGSDSIYYLINVHASLTDIDSVLNLANPRAFMIEIDPDVSIGDLVTTRLHPAGVRAFTYEKSQLAQTTTYQNLYAKGYDVVSGNAGSALVEARVAVNQSQGVTPP